MIARWIGRGAALCGLLLLAACTLPPPKLYVLNPIAMPDVHAPLTGHKVRTLAILPVSVPDYLDRRQIISRATDQRLAVDDSAHWGEGLANGFARVLTVDLGQLLAPDGFVVSSGGRQPKVDAELSLTIDAFEVDPQGKAVLAARWMIADEHRGAAASFFQAVYSEPVGVTSGAARTPAAVAALNRDVDRLARDIARSVRQVVRQTPVR